MELIITIIIAVAIQLITENPKKRTRWKSEKKTNRWDEAKWQKKAKTNIQKVATYAKQRGETIRKQVLEKAGDQITNTFDAHINYEMPKRMIHTTPIKEQLQESRLNVEQQIPKRQMEHKNSSILQPAKENVVEDVDSNDRLLAITDLMVKGYEGKLCFERDFLGEAMDMISRFQPPTELPNYTISDMKF